ncbi:unnamed protein product, partial [Ceratitis capitata]
MAGERLLFYIYCATSSSLWNCCSLGESSAVVSAKVSADLVRAEIKNVKSHILQTEPTRLSRLSVHHKLQLTMMKESSTQRHAAS